MVDTRQKDRIVNSEHEAQFEGLGQCMQQNKQWKVQFMYAILKKEKEFTARENPLLAFTLYKQFRQSYTASQLIYP